METETILRAIENGKLNDAREGIDEVLLNKIADSLEEKRQGLGDTLVGVCEDCEEEIAEIKMDAKEMKMEMAAMKGAMHKEMAGGGASEMEIAEMMKKMEAMTYKEMKELMHKEGIHYETSHMDEESDYDAFFKKAMKKFNISSPADLKSEEEKKKFFNYVDKNYKAEKETD